MKKKLIKMESSLDIDLTEDLTQKILTILDGNTTIDVLCVLLNVLVNVHIMANLDINHACDSIKKMYDQALKEEEKLNEVH